MPFTVSDLAREIAQRLRAAGQRVYLVGGAVRDQALGRTPTDFDLATDALPTRVVQVLSNGWNGPRPVVEDEAFGRVLVGDVDVLTLRREAEYHDRRRPSRVIFTKSIRADLDRRDFTINAMAVNLADGALIDPHGGMRDLKWGLLRSVGSAERRLGEDALRVLRAVRLRAELGFSYHPHLASALASPSAAECLRTLSEERVRDELSRTLLSVGVLQGLEDLRRFGLVSTILPECLPMVGCLQRNPMHRWDVWGHTLRVTQAISPELRLRWAALLHDVGKPATCAVGADGVTHFYGHERLGEEMGRHILRRLRYPDALVRQVAALVRHHMFHYGPETRIGSARRLVLALGQDGVRDLLELRRADRQASAWGFGVGPEGERLLAHLAAIGDERFTLPDLQVDGYDVMRELGLSAGPMVGETLHAMHQLVLDGQLPNRREDLVNWLRRRMANAPEAPAEPADHSQPPQNSRR